MNSLKNFFFLSLCLVIISCNSDSSSSSSNKETKPNASSNAKQVEAKTTGSKIIETSNGKYHSFDAGAKPYRMNIPIDWIVKEHAKSGSVAAKSSTKDTKDTFGEMIEVNIRQARRSYNQETKKMEIVPMSLKENIDNYLEGLKRVYKDMEVESMEAVKIGGKNAQLATYTYLHDKEFANKLKAQTFISQYESDNYILTFKAAANQFEVAQPVFEDVKKSFEFE